MLPQAKHWEVRVGEYHQKMDEYYEKTYQVSEVFHYPLYKGYDNDIALMKLTESVETTEFVQPICLPQNTNMDFFDKNCVASGWGKLDHSKSMDNSTNFVSQFFSLLQTKKVPIFYRKCASKCSTIRFVSKPTSPSSK